jgi:hypothetical protein
VLNGFAQHGDAELRHRAGRFGDDLALAELGYGNGDCFIERFRLDLDSVIQALLILIQIRDAATRNTHGEVISRMFVFCSP